MNGDDSMDNQLPRTNKSDGLHNIVILHKRHTISGRLHNLKHFNF